MSKTTMSTSSTYWPYLLNYMTSIMNIWFAPPIHLVAPPPLRTGDPFNPFCSSPQTAVSTQLYVLDCCNYRIGGSDAITADSTRWMSCYSEGTGCCSKSLFIFHLFSSSLSHWGPSHQMLCSASSTGKIPLKAQLVGFLLYLTWCQ